MVKVALNKCCGEFKLSEAGARMYSELARTPKPVYTFDGEVKRTDPNLLLVIEKLGKAAGGASSALGVVEVPDDVKWTIYDYNGAEWVAEVHRTWRAAT